MCCLSGGAKIVTLRQGSVGAAKNHRSVARGGMQNTKVARNGLMVWNVNVFVILVFNDEMPAYASINEGAGFCNPRIHV